MFFSNIHALSYKIEVQDKRVFPCLISIFLSNFQVTNQEPGRK